MKRLVVFLGWLFSVPYIYLSASSAYAVIFPESNQKCATPLFSAIVFLLFPCGLVMGAIVWKDYQYLRRNMRSGMKSITAVKMTRAILGSLCVLAMTTIALPILIQEVLLSGPGHR